MHSLPCGQLFAQSASLLHRGATRSRTPFLATHKRRLHPSQPVKSTTMKAAVMILAVTAKEANLMAMGGAYQPGAVADSRRIRLVASGRRVAWAPVLDALQSMTRSAPSFAP
jgi:hypothetical protein